MAPTASMKTLLKPQLQSQPSLLGQFTPASALVIQEVKEKQKNV